MRTRPRPDDNTALYWLVVLAVICASVVLAGSIREVCGTLSGNLEVLAR